MCKQGVIYLKLILVSQLGLLVSGCATDRLITRNNHNHDLYYCWQRVSESNGNAVALNNKLERDIEYYQILLEEALTQRELAIKLLNDIKRDVKHNAPIPPLLLEKLNVGMAHGLELTDRIASSVASNECWLQATNDTLAAKNLKPIDPYTRYKGFLVAFSATLVLYDTYYTTANIINQDARLRQFLNQSDYGYGRAEHQLKAVTDTIFRTENILLVKKEIQFYEENLPIHFSKVETDPSASYLYTLIQQSPAYTLIRYASIDDIMEQQQILAISEFDDDLVTAGRSTMNEVSKLFGNIVGLVEERKGKLYQDKTSHDHIASTLKAGDILLEKTPFRLTDKMIPGHWGHAAIWVGTKSELEDLGIWEHPIVQRYHKEIINSQSVVEALRSGVEMNTLAHFMNIDDIAILRDPQQSKLSTAARILRVLRQVGKEYDFNYNVETTDKIVCSQLVYIAYSSIAWPTERVLGRYTISPDNIAFKATNTGPLKLVVFYHDGVRVDNNAVSLMETLIQ